MTNQEQTLTTSNIKYLLVCNDLDHEKDGIRSVDVAEMLGITKPSVHTMMKTLKALKLIKKDKYGEAHFTECGRLLAEKYSNYFKTVCSYFRDLLPKESDVKSAAYALLAEIPEESLKQMCEKMKMEKGILL